MTSIIIIIVRPTFPSAMSVGQNRGGGGRGRPNILPPPLATPLYAGARVVDVYLVNIRAGFFQLISIVCHAKCPGLLHVTNAPVTLSRIMMAN